MVLKTGSIFPNAKEGADEFFEGQADWAVANFIILKKATQFTQSTTVLVDDDELFFGMAANTKYKFTLVMRYQGDDNTADVAWSFTVPTDTVGGYYYEEDYRDGQWTPHGQAITDRIDTVSTQSAYEVKMEGVIETGGYTGKLQFQFASRNNVSSKTNILAGSYLTMERQ